MLDHISIGVRDLERSIAFYDAVTAPLGYARLFVTAKAAGWGTPPGKDEAFAVIQEAADSPCGSSFMSHIAFIATTRAAVEAFYEAAMKHGAESQGEPGLCPQYGENYFAAFVGDIDGYNIEAVCHAVEGA